MYLLLKRAIIFMPDTEKTSSTIQMWYTCIQQDFSQWYVGESFLISNQYREGKKAPI